MEKLDCQYEDWIPERLRREALDIDREDEKENNRGGNTSQFLNKEVTLRILKDYTLTHVPSFKPDEFTINIGKFGLKPSELKQWKVNNKDKKIIHIIDNLGNECDLHFKGPTHAKWFAYERLIKYKEAEEEIDSE